MRVHRAIWLVLDQAISSATTFVMSIAVARSVSVEDFGAFAIAFSLYVFAVEFSRAISLEPLLIVFSAQARDVIGAAASKAMGFSLYISFIASIILLAAAGVVETSLRGVLAVLAASLPGLLLQDSIKLALIAQKRVIAALLNDSAWAVMLACGILILGPSNPGAAGFMGIWGLTGTLAGAMGIAQLRSWPELRTPLAWFRDHRSLSMPIVGDFLSEGGAIQACLLIIGWLEGLKTLGSLNAARILMGPMGILLLFANNLITTEGARLIHRGRTSQYRRLVGLGSSGLALITIVWATCLLALPSGVGTQLLGESADGAFAFLAPVAAFFAYRGAVLAIRVGLRLAREPMASFRLQLFASAIMIAGTFLGAWFGGPLGAAWGMVAPALLVPIWAQRFLHLARPRT